MNNTELIARISRRSGINEEACREVLHAFEETMAEGLSEKKWKTKTFASACRIMNNIRQKQESRQ